MSRTVEIRGEYKFIYVRDVASDADGVDVISRCAIGPNAPAIDDETAALKVEHHTTELVAAYNASLVQKGVL